MCWAFDNNQPLKIDVPTDDHKLALPSRLNELRKNVKVKVFSLIIIISKCRVIVVYFKTPSVLKILFFFSTRLFQAESFHGPETPRVANDHKNCYNDTFQVKGILFHFTIFDISLTH